MYTGFVWKFRIPNRPVEPLAKIRIRKKEARGRLDTS